jgi:phosphotransferase system HPr-like phosphotransfer protein
MLEVSKRDGQVFAENVRLVHAVGMHARPAVKLTKLAKKFQAQVSFRLVQTILRNMSLPAIARTGLSSP